MDGPENLLDSGASACYVSLEVAKKLKQKVNRTLGGSEVKYPNGTVLVSSAVARLKADLGGKTLNLVLEVLQCVKNDYIRNWYLDRQQNQPAIIYTRIDNWKH